MRQMLNANRPAPKPFIPTPIASRHCLSPSPAYSTTVAPMHFDKHLARLISFPVLISTRLVPLSRHRSLRRVNVPRSPSPSLSPLSSSLFPPFFLPFPFLPSSLNLAAATRPIGRARCLMKAGSVISALSHPELSNHARVFLFASLPSDSPPFRSV